VADGNGEHGRLVEQAIVRLRVRVFALACAALGGTGLSFATAWLLVRGGADVGKHLNLLGHFFPGYAVTWWGCVVGFAYGAVAAGATGWLFASVYNSLVRRRHD
jgi:hypothetical protein